jgi:hypothetical protein
VYDIYASAKRDAWRFTLGKKGTKPLFIIGLNPSTATREKSDTTVAKVERVAAKHGYEGFVMLNLYPIRATDFRTLPSTVNQTAFTANLDQIDRVVGNSRNPTVWAAWGDNVTHHAYFLDARDELATRLAAHNVRWLRFGNLTAAGHPRHPSRLSYAWNFEPFDPAAT